MEERALRRLRFKKREKWGLMWALNANRPEKPFWIRALRLIDGGDGGIRTLGTVSRTTL